VGSRARQESERASKRATRNAPRAAGSPQAPAMPAAKSEDLRWLMVYKRVVEEAPQKAIAAHCRERCQSRERDFNN
jgi:hypothetical protein